MIPRLKEQYYKTVAKSLTEKFKMKNKLMAPMPIKVVLNMGLGMIVICNDDMVNKVLSSVSGSFVVGNISKRIGEKQVLF